ncbi:MAG: hypothetical protein ABJE95_22135 [Byssovorax sp.]
MISVSATNIFAREAAEGGQYLAYSMTLGAADKTIRRRLAIETHEGVLLLDPARSRARPRASCAAPWELAAAAEKIPERPECQGDAQGRLTQEIQ